MLSAINIFSDRVREQITRLEGILLNDVELEERREEIKTELQNLITLFENTMTQSTRETNSGTILSSKKGILKTFGMLIGEIKSIEEGSTLR